MVFYRFLQKDKSVYRQQHDYMLMPVTMGFLKISVEFKVGLVVNTKGNKGSKVHCYQSSAFGKVNNMVLSNLKKLYTINKIYWKGKRTSS